MIKNLLPSNSRVWVYQSVRKLPPDHVESALIRLKQFVSGWTSHREGVVGDGTLLYDRFIILMADENQVGISGCSVDSSVRFLKELEKELETNFFDRWNIAYKKDREVLSCNIAEFGELVKKGEIHDETIVFNNLVQSKKEFEEKWQVPYKNSWLKNIEAANSSFGSLL